MTKYILLTGGTGFIGSHLLKTLLNENKKVILLKRSFSNTWRINELLDNQNLILKNIDEEPLNNIFNQYAIEGILHLSAFSQRAHKSNSVSKMIQSNIEFPTNLLENSVNNNCKYFINTGSFFEYELTNPPISENNKIKPFNLYGSTKIAFEDLLKYYSLNYDLKCSTLKLFTPYGPKDDTNKIIPYLIIKSIKKDPIHIKSPTKKLDFVYITDIMNAYLSLIKNIMKLDDYESFNVGTNIGTSIKDILNIIESILGKNNDVTYGNVENEEIWCSNNKIKNMLNWNPVISLQTGINHTINYYKKVNK